MRTRYIADLNPSYPNPGERRYAIFRAHGDRVTRLGHPTFASRRVAERRACALQVRASLEALGISLQSKD